MAVFTESPNEVRKMITDIRAKSYKDLDGAEVTITSIMAYAKKDDQGKPMGSAIKVNGYAALATIQVTSHKFRIAGLADAIMTIDGDRWESLSIEDQESMIDHELYHLMVKLDSQGFVEGDDSGRPKLKIREHDWQTGGFAEIARRHGANSHEVQQLKAIQEEYEIVVFE